MIESAVGGDGDILFRSQMRRVPRGHTRGGKGTLFVHGIIGMVSNSLGDTFFFIAFADLTLIEQGGNREEAIAMPRFSLRRFVRLAPVFSSLTESLVVTRPQQTTWSGCP